MVSSVSLKSLFRNPEKTRPVELYFESRGTLSRDKRNSGWERTRVSERRTGVTRRVKGRRRVEGCESLRWRVVSVDGPTGVTVRDPGAGPGSDGRLRRGTDPTSHPRQRRLPSRHSRRGGGGARGQTVGTTYGPSPGNLA